MLFPTFISCIGYGAFTVNDICFWNLLSTWTTFAEKKLTLSIQQSERMKSVAHVQISRVTLARPYNRPDAIALQNLPIPSNRNSHSRLITTKTKFTEYTNF